MIWILLLEQYYFAIEHCLIVSFGISEVVSSMSNTASRSTRGTGEKCLEMKHATNMVFGDI